MKEAKMRKDIYLKENVKPKCNSRNRVVKVNNNEKIRPVDLETEMKAGAIP